MAEEEKAPLLTAAEEKAPLLTAAEEEKAPLPYIQENILKKRKSKETLAVIRKNQLELGRYELAKKRRKEEQIASIKRPEQFIQEFRAKELDLVRMKHRAKRVKSTLVNPKSNLLFIIRIQGLNEMHPRTRKIIHSLRLRKRFTGVFARASEGILEKLQKVEPYVTYGFPNLRSVRELIVKKGCGKVDRQRVPLTDNNIVEQELGKYNIISIEDIIHEIATVGPHFKEVVRFLEPFVLTKPDGGFLGKKQPYKEGGEAGNREDEINDLITKMN